MTPEPLDYLVLFSAAAFALFILIDVVREVMRKRLWRSVASIYRGSDLVRLRKNRFDVQVVFHDHAFGLKSRSDVDLTPEDVLTELGEFCARIRRTLESGKADPAVVTSGELAKHELTTRDA